MDNNIKKDLNNARRLKNSKKYDEALEIFENHYSNHPDAFEIKDKNDFAWTLYYARIQNSKDSEEIFESANSITELIPQRDLNTNPSCVYTSAVFKVLKYLKDNGEFYSMIPWLDKIDAELLDTVPFRKYGRINKSKKELYYDYASAAYLKSGQYDDCIKISKEALTVLDRFTDDADTWYKWRIAKSLKELGQAKEAISYFKEVILVKHDWYIYRDIAEIYYDCRMPNDALDYVCPAVLSPAPAKNKVNLYHLIYKILDSIKSNLSMIHAQFTVLLKHESGAQIPYELKKLNINPDELNHRELEKQIRDLWIQYKFKNRKRMHGTVVKYVEDRHFGFIKTADDEEIFFHKREFNNDNIYIGQLVSFYTEKSFDKAKNSESLKAVNIKGE